MIPFVGFAPDLPPESPGIFLDCTNILPGINGFSAAPSALDCSLGAVSGPALGFAVTRTLDGSTRTFCGTADKLYEVVTGAWDDKSKVGGYAIGPDYRWRFAQFGNVTLASSKASTIQSITTGDFADASGTAPKAAIVETINNQVFAFDIDGMGFGDDATRWACSALGDYTDWTPDIDTQCASGQLLDAPGPITAGRRLGNIIVAYKEQAMYVGQYVGAPLIWDFQRIPGDIGAPSQESVINTGMAHYFIGPDDFYVFDGARPQALNSPLREWFFNNYDQRFAYRICGTFDRINQRVYWWFPTSGSNGTLTKCVVLNVKTGQWGKVSLTIEFAAEYITPGVTYDQLGSLWATYDDLPTYISYNSPFWKTGSSVVAVFQTDHKAYQLSGVPGESRIITGHYGNLEQFSTVTMVKPRFTQPPTSSTCLYSHANDDESSFTQNLSSTYGSGRYDLLWSARWHKFEFVFNGSTTITGMDVSLTPDGQE
jgi:hypothetical protein